MVERYQKTRDERLRVAVLERYRRVTEIIARRFEGSRVPVEDLIQEGRLGLLRALETYDETKGSGFTSYAARRVASSMKHYIRDHGRLIRQPAWLQELNQRVQRTEQTLVARAMVLDDADGPRQRGLAPRVQFREQGRERVAQDSPRGAGSSCSSRMSPTSSSSRSSRVTSPTVRC